MYKIPARTLFMGKSLIYMPECHSTNDVAAQILDQSSTIEGTVVITDRQTKGKGQRGNSWITTHYENLTFSVILKPSFLAPNDQFYLNVVVSLGVHDVVSPMMELPVFIKWPNDVMAGGRKIAGMLLENQLYGKVIRYSVAGIGLNVNQRKFSIPTATSLAIISGEQYDRTLLLEDLLERIEVRYLELRQGKREALRAAYTNVMFWKNEQHTFVAGNRVFTGTITGIDDSGRLCIMQDGQPLYFGAREVSYQR